MQTLGDELEQLCEVMGRQLHLRLDEHCGDAVDVALVSCELVVSEQGQVGLWIVCPALDLQIVHSKITGSASTRWEPPEKSSARFATIGRSCKSVDTHLLIHMALQLWDQGWVVPAWQEQQTMWRV